MTSIGVEMASVDKLRLHVDGSFSLEIFPYYGTFLHSMGPSFPYYGTYHCTISHSMGTEILWFPYYGISWHLLSHTIGNASFVYIEFPIVWEIAEESSILWETDFKWLAKRSPIVLENWSIVFKFHAMGTWHAKQSEVP